MDLFAEKEVEKFVAAVIAALLACGNYLDMY